MQWGLLVEFSCNSPTPYLIAHWRALLIVRSFVLEVTSGCYNKGGTEEIVEVTRVVGDKLAKIANINLDLLIYAETMSCPDRAQWRAACAEELE